MTSAKPSHIFPKVSALFNESALIRVYLLITRP